jgi:membrane peptidoglycan carboxypeptidase
MRNITPILRARRERRLARRQRNEARLSVTGWSVGFVISILLAALIFTTAFAYADLTRALPSIELLPLLLNPPDGALLEPTRIFDRTGTHILYTFAPSDLPRRYIPLGEQNPQHIPDPLAQAVVAMADVNFWRHSGYAINGLNNPDLHPTIAQKLVYDLLLYNEPPTIQRAVRERILAAQITARYGRSQVLEWYLNSTHFGRYAYGVDSAARLYFGKSATDLTLAESAMLAAVSQSPSLNPLDAPQVAVQRGREAIYVLQSLGTESDADIQAALVQTPTIQPASLSTPNPAEAFTNLVLSQLDSRFPRARIERGGLTITTTLDYDLQGQASCVTEIYAARLAGLPEPETPCNAARFLPSLPPGITLADSSTSALILDPNTGQILAVVGETIQARETPLLTAHRPGSMLDAFVYLTGFTRGLSPASLIWDIPGQVEVQNFDNEYHGPMRLRTALANDYQAPAAQVQKQMGVDNVTKIAGSFGLSFDKAASLVDMAGAYGVFGTQGVYFGQEVGDAFEPVSVLKVETADGSIWLDWTSPQARSVVSSALAYLMTNALSDESARWPGLGNPNVTEIGRPAAVKLGGTRDGLDAWTVGYTHARTVAVWTGTHDQSLGVTPRVSAVLWSALMQLSSQNFTPDGWAVPPGVTVMNVCDPSGMLPTSDCPNVVSEVFAYGNEPVQTDNLYRKFSVNRETGFLATVFTPPQLVENRVYLIVPPEAREWARSAGLQVPPDAYDAIQPSPRNPDVNISAPAMFADVKETVKIVGTASGADFLSYRVLVGQGLNPQKWIQVSEGLTAVVDGLLAEWDTSSLSGLYAVQLQVVRSDQRVDSAVIQVTVK